MVDYFSTADVNVANGIAGLDASGHVLVANLPAAVTGAMNYVGTWDADTNTPTLSDSGGGGVQGDYYVVSVAGTTSLDGIADWEIGDWVVNSGLLWQKIDNTDKVASVNGATGVVVLTYTDVGAEQAFTKNSAFNKDFGTGSGDVCEGNDSRLSDNRTDADAIHKTTAGEIDAMTAKGAVVDADIIVIEDSAATYGKKKSLMSVVKTYVLNALSHASLTGVTSDQHHAKSHNHDAASGAGAIATDQVFKAGDGGTTNYLQIATSGIMSFFGTARFKRCLEYYPYNIGGIAGTYNGVTCAAAGLGALNGMYFKSFDDGGGVATAEACNVSFILPESYEAGTDIEIASAWTAPATTGVCRWQGGLAKVSNGEDFSTASYTWGTPLNETAPATAWLRGNIGFTISGTGLNPLDEVSVVVFRDADNAADTLIGDAYLAVVGIKFTCNKLGGTV